MTQTGTTTAAADAERRVFAKIGWRLMPILILAYIFNYLDRNNVGFAGLTMNQAIGLTATQLGFGAGVFFLGYCLLEIPSNLVLYRVGARVWLSRIMISWGLASAATALARELLPDVALKLGPSFDLLVTSVIALFDGETTHRFLVKDSAMEEARLALLVRGVELFSRR